MFNKKTKTKTIKKTFQNKFFWIGLNIFSSFCYLLFVFFSAINVAELKQIQKNIENKNAELAMLEIDYINRENITMLKDGSVLSFVQAENIIYTSNIPEPNGLALVDKN